MGWILGFLLSFLGGTKDPMNVPMFVIGLCFAAMFVIAFATFLSSTIFAQKALERLSDAAVDVALNPDTRNAAMMASGYTVQYEVTDISTQRNISQVKTFSFKISALGEAQR